MQSNTAIVNAGPNAAPLQLPEETASLIKASIAENTLKAYQWRRSGCSGSGAE